jgi:ABC-type nitrate/sulfonate/bicarbonate transport system substrate-binding protein
MLSRRATLGAIASVPFATTSAVRAQTALPISIGTQADSHWLTLEAQKKGIFEKVGLAPTYVKFTAGAPMMAAAQSKSIDVATVGMVPFLAGVGQGIPWVAIGFHVAGSRGEGILARKGAGIKTLADLKGKRIGFFRASTAHYGLFKALEKGGVKPDQVTLLSMAPAQQLAAMRANEIDAASVWEPWMHKLVAEADGELISTEADIGVLTAASTLAVRRDWLSANRETARRLLKGYLVAYDSVHADPQPVIQQFAQNVGISDQWSGDIFKSVPPVEIKKWADPGYEYSLAKGSKIQLALADLATFLLEQKVVPQAIDVNGLLDDSVIIEVMKAGAGK